MYRTDLCLMVGVVPQKNREDNLDTFVLLSIQKRAISLGAASRKLKMKGQSQPHLHAMNHSLAGLSYAFHI